MAILGVFAKFWAPGQVKTRLAGSIGKDNAARLYLHFLRATLSLAAPLDCRKIIGFTPANQSTAFEKMFSDWEFVPQSEGDLGKRMRTFFSDCFRIASDTETPSKQSDRSNHERGEPDPPRVVLIGSDTPNLPSQRIELAFEKLRSHDLVIGPSNDGGYYLIGFRSKPLDLFSGIRWSSDSVIEETRQKIRSQGIDHFELEPFYDVDEQKDLEKLLHELKASLSGLTSEQKELLVQIEMILEQGL